MLDYMCDWFECLLHEHIHTEYYLKPMKFSRDKDILKLWNMGLNFQTMGNFSPWKRAQLLQQFATAATEYADRPELWAHVGKAMQKQKPRTWTHPKVDALIINLWPLVKHYNWTYEDLLNVVGKRLQIPMDRYPCDSVDSLKVHCRTVLGLTKSCKGKSVGLGKLPEGWQIAEQL